MGNYKKKKDAADVHNFAQDISNHILPVGTCKCGCTTFMYLKSKLENVPKYYCENTECEVGDIRNPKDGDTFFYGLYDIAKVVIAEYEDTDIADKVVALFNEEVL